MEKILFYRTTEDYGAFSNFSPHPFTLKGVIWPTSEHYFQAQKFADLQHQEEIRKVASPMVAARMGRSRKRPLRSDWDVVKEDVMREALAAKFAQNLAIRSLLLATGDAELVEHTANDRYWADGGDGTGRNRLGQLLMELRSQMQSCPQSV
ncbi:MAG TPA: NADAR family protein [Candidatus Limnocylindria bacterium]|nr:NADAR family protein [Candidatus Limnocylindria bacterium]